MRLNEIFYSIQGEGYFTGTPAVFIRLSGCNLKCPFCDTDHTRFVEKTENEIVRMASQYPCHHAVITGGEPSLQLTESFVRKLKEAGFFVQVETNGTRPLPNNVDWVTCSPKEYGEVVLRNPNEVKIVYIGQDLGKYDDMTAGVYYLQPCSCENTEKVVEYIKEHTKWRLSLQTQKILHLR